LLRETVLCSRNRRRISHNNPLLLKKASTDLVVLLLDSLEKRAAELEFLCKKIECALIDINAIGIAVGGGEFAFEERVDLLEK
jgi:hypothetical protein